MSGPVTAGVLGREGASRDHGSGAAGCLPGGQPPLAIVWDGPHGCDLSNLRSSRSGRAW
jgi:hypothetical protein